MSTTAAGFAFKMCACLVHSFLRYRSDLYPMQLRISACIGQARSSFDEGVVNHVNALAVALGMRENLPLRAQLDAIIN
jgi:hypothetical protein